MGEEPCKCTFAYRRRKNTGCLSLGLSSTLSFFTSHIERERDSKIESAHERQRSSRARSKRESHPVFLCLRATVRSDKIKGEGLVPSVKGGRCGEESA